MWSIFSFSKCRVRGGEEFVVEAVRVSIACSRQDESDKKNDPIEHVFSLLHQLRGCA